MKILGWMVFATMLLTSCFEVSEEIIIDTVGGGTYKTTVDVSQMKTMMESMKTDSMREVSNGVDSFHIGMLKSLKESADKYKQTAGVSNVNYSSDQFAATYTISFDFNNIKSLNAALKDKNGIDKYDWKKGKFTVKGSGFNPMAGEDTGDESNDEMMKTMFADAKFNLKITVPKKVKKASNNLAQVSGKTVLLNSTFGDWMNSSGSQSLIITYK